MLQKVHKDSKANCLELLLLLCCLAAAAVAPYNFDVPVLG